MPRSLEVFKVRQESRPAAFPHGRRHRASASARRSAKGPPYPCADRGRVALSSLVVCAGAHERARLRGNVNWEGGKGGEETGEWRGSSGQGGRERGLSECVAGSERPRDGESKHGVMGMTPWPESMVRRGD
jgi:hypothetical protein